MHKQTFWLCRCWRDFRLSFVLFFSDSVNTSRYCPLFNAHLQVCVDRQTLSAASDTVDFMLAQNLAVDHTTLQTLLQKLGKQNLWLRAREVFKREVFFFFWACFWTQHRKRCFTRLVFSRFPECGVLRGRVGSPGCHDADRPVSVGRGRAGSRLWDVHHCQRHSYSTYDRGNHLQPQHHSKKVSCVGACEISGWITQPCFICDTAASLFLSSSRTQSCEREYLSAGSRVLSAACITQPKLIIHFKAVNPSQEQMFTVDVSSARSWLRHNLSWANEMWAHWASPRHSSLHFSPRRCIRSRSPLWETKNEWNQENGCLLVPLLFVLLAVSSFCIVWEILSKRWAKASGLPRVCWSCSAPHSKGSISRNRLMLVSPIRWRASTNSGSGLRYTYNHEHLEKFVSTRNVNNVSVYIDMSL